MLAFGSLAICAVSGIALASVYRVDAAQDSLALLQLKNPAGQLLRSLHDWSAQFLLVLTALHAFDWLRRKGERRTTTPLGMWIRLSLSAPLLVAAMLSGFLLRGDPPATEALRLLRVVLQGGALSRMLAGDSGLATIHLHHVSTATLLLWLFTAEHARRLLPAVRPLWTVLLWMLLPVLLLVPGLAWRTSAIESGPWYLLGFEELFRWVSNPLVVLALVLAATAALALLPKLPLAVQSRVKWTLAGMAVLYAALSLTAGWRDRGALGMRARWSPSVPETLLASAVPMIAGRREGCLACHAQMTGFAKEHDPKRLGCESCHLGNPFTLDKASAHAGMTRTPGNLSIVSETCASANCHVETSNRVRRSLMNTMSGVVAVDKVVFGESADLDQRHDIAKLGAHSPADTHLRTLCASCHVGQDKSAPGPIDTQSRGGGCSACHLRYDGIAATPKGEAPKRHPEISVNIPRDACFGCHSRSGRISTNYEGWHESLGNGTRKLADGRVFGKRTADVHFEKGLACVDCHVAAEVMGGEGAHASDAIRIACDDCHGSTPAAARTFAALDAETQAVVELRGWNVAGREFVGPYPNVFREGTSIAMLLKESGKRVTPKPASAACAKARAMGHERLSCNACHSDWAPQCVGCHTRFDAAGESWDHLAGRDRKGEWIEEPADFLSDAPALGVYGKQVTTFAPGMILHLENRPFQRLYAPVSPHTTVKKARDCKSCHANPAAMGYGRGTLRHQRGEWTFEPRFAAAVEDGLPRDAWIPFLREAHAKSTRKNARPFDLAEQRKILLVGACLQCHSEKEPRIAAVFADFRNYRRALRPACTIGQQ